VAKRILKLSEQNKGIYLKLGQYLGNLERVVPREFTEILKVLQDSAPSLPFEEIRIVVDEDLGKSVEEIYQEFDKEAIAAASLAQVHRAKLHSG
jgi:aarF domain-containing kinase